jgi:carboxypeptidase Taq
MTDDLANQFRRLSRTIHDLQQAQGVLDWDQQTMMPRRGTTQRGQQLAALATVIHEKLTAPKLGDVMTALEEKDDLDPLLQADLRELKRERDRAVKIPEELVAERARVCAEAQAAWENAYEGNNFALFQPHLEQVLDIVRRVTAALARDGASAYDLMLEEYEPGATEEQLRELFDGLGPTVTELLERILDTPLESRPNRDLLRGRFPVAAQERFLRKVIERIGFDFDAGRVDRSVHPFTAGTMNDVRVTNRYRESNLAPAIFGMIHEAGHALYEQGLDPERYRDPAGGYCSLGVHESQSRLWENLIGRSRPFWSFHLPLLKEAFPALAPVDLDAFLGAINEVRPSLVRVDADEVTYNLHIILRFRLESAMLSGDLDVADLPGAWKEQTQKLFGLQPATDREGALQDVHWSAGLFGYFPTYALGNLYGAQFLEAMRRDLTDLDEKIGAGELAPIKQWLNEKIHRQGRRYLAPELCERVTGAPLSPEPALSHLERKYGALYGL